MSLTSTTSFFRKNIGAFIFISLFTIVGVIIYNKLFPKNDAPKLPILEQQTPISFPIKVKSFETGNITTGKEEKEMDVYERKDGISFLSNIKSIQQKFSVTENERVYDDPDKGRSVTTSGSKGFLVLYDNYLSYNAIAQKPNDTTANFNETTIATIVDNYYKSLDLPINLPDKYSIDYTHFVGEDFYEDGSQENASWANFKYIDNIGNYPVISPTNQTTMSINRSGEVMKVEIFSPQERHSVGEYPVISFTKALDILKMGGGYPVKIDGGGALYVIDPKHRNLNSLTVTNAYLGYFSSKEFRADYPAWIFEGEGEVNNLPLNVTYMVYSVDPSLFETP